MAKYPRLGGLNSRDELSGLQMAAYSLCPWYVKVGNTALSRSVLLNLTKLNLSHISLYMLKKFLKSIINLITTSPQTLELVSKQKFNPARNEIGNAGEDS